MTAFSLGKEHNMSPIITKMEVYPVAGKDCMELNLSGAHAPYFTRNVVILHADNGELGVGEVPGGQKITKALEECIPLVEGTKVSEYKSTLLKVKKYLDSNAKYYVVDLGLRTALLGQKDMDAGHILENVVYLELLRRGYNVSVGRIYARCSAF